MEITINNELQSVPENSTLEQLIFSQTGGNHKGIAVAINQQVLPRERWHHTTVQPQDSILIIKATQGG